MTAAEHQRMKKKWREKTRMARLRKMQKAKCDVTQNNKIFLVDEKKLLQKFNLEHDLSE